MEKKKEHSCSHQDAYIYQKKFLELFNSIPSEKEREQFQQFVQTHFEEEKQNQDNKNKEERAKRDFLNVLIEGLRKKTSLSAEDPNEKIIIPQTEEYKGFKQTNIFHLDSFLYDREGVEEMVSKGELSLFYCLKCGSRDITELNLISHSASVDQLLFIYSNLKKIKGNNLKDLKIIDVGSRLGGALFVGYLFSEANIIGIEISKYFCDLQNEIINKYKMNKRLKVICDDVLNQKEILSNADVVIMNNVFQFFLPLKKQKEMWQYIHSNVTKSGSILITIPSLESTIKDAKTKIDLSSWVKELEIEIPQLEDEETEEDLQSIHFYQIL